MAASLSFLRPLCLAALSLAAAGAFAQGASA